jgi:hypothetical protein
MFHAAQGQHADVKPPLFDIKRLLQQSPEISALLDKARQHNSQLEHIRQHLPADMAAQVHAISLCGNTLELIVSSPAWASRLRFALPMLQRSLASEQALRVKTIPLSAPRSPSPRPPRPCPELSRRSAEQIRHIAQAISDETLRAALLRLASHTSPDKPKT